MRETSEDGDMFMCSVVQQVARGDDQGGRAFDIKYMHLE
jgi:hypothetical protein